MGYRCSDRLQPSHTLEVFDSFFRVGSLVFGGGHVVLPLLQTEVVGPGWITNEQFVAGYGATQAVPGPLFTFSAYLGAVMGPEPNGWTGAFLALVAIFLPSFLLVVGALPFWDTLRSAPVFQSALKGINAAVVGLLLTALYKPVWTSAIYSPGDFGLGLVAFGLLMFWKCPPWLVVALTAVGGEVMHAHISGGTLCRSSRTITEARQMRNSLRKRIGSRNIWTIPPSASSMRGQPGVSNSIA